ncbi:MAG: hypothetical protein ACK4HW_08410 [Roseinatronobacter sp.]
MSHTATEPHSEQVDADRLARIRRNARVVDTATGFARAHLTRQIIDDLLVLEANGTLGRISDILDRGRA